MGYTNRFGRTSYPMRAIARCLEKKGPLTVRSILENAALTSGKLLKDSKFALSQRQISSILMQHPDFYAHGCVKKTQTSSQMNLWMVEEDSMLLGTMDRSKQQSKTKLMGKET